MSSVDSKLVGLLQKQIEVEKRTLEMIAKVEEEVSETAVKLVFMELRLDSWKHQKFLEGILEMMNDTPCDEWSAKVQRYIDRVKLQKTLEALVVEEREMEQLAAESLRNTDDPVAKFLLQHLKEDETHHREQLEDLIRLIQSAPLQSKKAEKGSDIVCATEE
jgi:rubrerythrin